MDHPGNPFIQNGIVDPNYVTDYSFYYIFIIIVVIQCFFIFTLTINIPVKSQLLDD
jgi:hypothetical protein